MFWMIFFSFSNNLGFWVFLVHPTVVLVLLSALVERCFVSRMRDFLVTQSWACFKYLLKPDQCFSRMAFVMVFKIPGAVGTILRKAMEIVL